MGTSSAVRASGTPSRARAARFEHLAGGGACDRQALAMRLQGPARAGGHDEVIAVAEHDHQPLGPHQRARSLDDQLENTVEFVDAADRLCDVSRRLERPHGVLELLAALL